MIIFSFLTLDSLNLLTAPAMSESMTDLFHRECTIAILKVEPSNVSGNRGRSLMVSLIVSFTSW